MAMLNDRLAEFIGDRFPVDGVAVELLCMDHVGTYLIPFPCCRAGQSWRNLRTGEVVSAEVVGWRPKR
ncbi:MAG: hypothetical protein ACLPID_08090 [Beijerinckiaceae bacterium]